ncbi:MAG: hypothetical protein AAB553_02355 [Patescibacteria group bacterium]
MKKLFKHVWDDKIIKWGMGSAAIVFFFSLIILAIFYWNLPPYLPVYNQMPWGEERLATKYEIILPQLIAFSFFVLNFSLSRKLYDKMPLISRMLSITTLLTMLLSFVFLVRTLLLLL